MCAFALTLALAGCGSGFSSGSSSGPSTQPRPSPAPGTTSPQTLCSKLISHWARVVVDGGAQADLDYQAMGLSGGQNEILLAVVAAARTEERTQGRPAAEKLIDRQASGRCAERYRDGDPTGGPWQ